MRCEFDVFVLGLLLVVAMSAVSCRPQIQNDLIGGPQIALMMYQSALRDRDVGRARSYLAECDGFSESDANLRAQADLAVGGLYFSPARCRAIDDAAVLLAVPKRGDRSVRRPFEVVPIYLIKDDSAEWGWVLLPGLFTCFRAEFALPAEQEGRFAQLTGWFMSESMRLERTAYNPVFFSAASPQELFGATPAKQN